MNAIKLWLCERYCPEFYFKVPFYDDNREYIIQVIAVYGYWSNKTAIVSTRIVRGRKQAYYQVRWDALKADLIYWPKWLCDSGIHYSIQLKDSN